MMIIDIQMRKAQSQEMGSSSNQDSMQDCHKNTASTRNSEVSVPQTNTQRTNQSGDCGKSNKEFFEEYTKLYEISYQIKQQIATQLAVKQKLFNKLLCLEERQDHQKKQIDQEDLDSSSTQKKEPRKKRRLATQIERRHQCPGKNCDREYGLEGSLIQHIKLKHPEIYHSKV